MIQGMLIVGLSGGLVYNGLSKEVYDVDIDKVIGMASTVYTGVEILQEDKMFLPHTKYRTARFVFEHGEITAFKTETKLMFIILHKNTTEKEVLDYLTKIHKHYIEKVLYNPLYKVDRIIPPGSFSE